MTNGKKGTALDAALARVSALEKEIAEHGRPRAPRSSAHLVALLVIGVFAITVASASQSARQYRVVRQEAPEKRPLPAEGELSLAPMALYSRMGPLLVDVNMDGQKDIVVPGWHEMRDDEPIYLAALDRNTFKVVWRAGPFTARPRDQRLSFDKSRVAGLLQVTDANGDTDVDLARGLMGPRSVSKPKDVVDPFLPRPVPPCPSDTQAPCLTTAADGVEELLAKATGAKHVFASTITGNDFQIQVASAIMPNDDSVEYVAHLAPDGTVRWVTPLLPAAQVRNVDMYTRTSPNEWTTIARGRVLHIYQLAKGPYRMLSRDLATGALQYDVQLGDLAQGSFLEWFSADKDDAFLVADSELVVLDAKTGEITHRIRTF